MSVESDNNGDKHERKNKERRRSHREPPFVDDEGEVVTEDRRLRPDPRLDKLIEADWDEDGDSGDTGNAGPEDQD